MENLISFFLVTALINLFCDVRSSYLYTLYRSLSNVFLCMHLSFLFSLKKHLLQTVTSHKLLLELKSSIIIREGLTPFNHCWKRLTKWLPKNRWNFWWKKEDTLWRKEVTEMGVRMRTKERGKKRKISKECELWKHVKQCIACEKNICETKHSTISFYFRAKLRVCDFVFDSASMKHKCIKLLFN